MDHSREGRLLEPLIGLESHDLSALDVPGLCADGRCFDEILLHGLDGIVREQGGDLVVVMHQLGNHGPAYHRRYPPGRGNSPTVALVVALAFFD